MKYFLILTLTTISIISCKSRKEVTKASEEEKVEVIDNIEEKKVEKTIQTIEDFTEEERREYELIQANFSDSLIAQIRRTPCFGHCPTYILNVYKSGFLHYTGERNVENIGSYSAIVDQSTLDKLMNKANEIGFFEMNYFYDNRNVTDLPTTITSIRNSSEIKSILNRFGSPKELMAFNKYFDELFADVDWQKIEK